MAPKRRTALEKWGRELARAVEVSGMTGKKLAEEVHVSPATISHWMSGKRMPHVKDVQLVEKAIGTNGYLERNLEEWVAREISPEWHAWARVEENADTILSFQPCMIPGMLQTEEYAGAVLSHNRYEPIGPDERLSARMERQAILDQDDPPMTVFIIGEAALHTRVGTPKTMYEQIIRLIEQAQRPEVIIQILPEDTGYHPGLAGAFLLARVNGKEVAYQDAIWKGQILEEEMPVSTLSKYWQHLLAKTLTAEASLELLKREAVKWNP